MPHELATSVSSGIAAEPRHIAEGIGAADRDFLALSLALFQADAFHRRLWKRARQLAERGADYVPEALARYLPADEAERAAEELKAKAATWRDGPVSDAELRLRLWVALRQAFGLTPRLTASERGIGHLSGEVAAGAIHAFDPPSRWQRLRERLGADPRERTTTLTSLAEKVLDDLTAAVMHNAPEESRQQLYASIRARLAALSEAEQQQLLDAIGADQFDDQAIRTMLLTSGGVGSFGLAVSAGGFSTYILAAQVSALIPLVSGPALVSLVAVLGSFATFILATVAVYGWAASRANRGVQAAMGVHVVALLTLTGSTAGRTDATGRLFDGFSRVEAIEAGRDLKGDTLQKYREEWTLLKPILAVTRPALDEEVSRLGNRPVWHDRTARTAHADSKKGEADEARVTAAVAALTVGDVAYSLGAIHPSILAAADFSRTEDLADPVAFAAFAQQLHEMDPAGVAGATANMRGYAAEQVVAIELTRQGHQVEFPEGPSEPGWDLLVDGEKMQVKCAQDAGAITKHFEHYEYPVLANLELADSIAPEVRDKVFFVENYSEEMIRDLANASLAQGADAFDPDVPLFVGCVSAARHARQYWRGRVTAQEAFEQR